MSKKQGNGYWIGVLFLFSIAFAFFSFCLVLHDLSKSRISQKIDYWLSEPEREASNE